MTFYSTKKIISYLLLILSMTACSMKCGCERISKTRPVLKTEEQGHNKKQKNTLPARINPKKNQPVHEHKSNKRTPKKNLPIYKLNPDFRAPKKYQHPLNASNKLTFMLGQDDNGFYLYAEGIIRDGDYKKFQRYVQHYKENGIILSRLMMHSPGGILDEGVNIGKFINTNKWSTDLDKHMKCYSSCAMIYAAGVEKFMQKGAELGFHRPYIADKPDTPELISHIYQYYQGYWDSLDGNHALYENFMLNYGRNEMLILTTDTVKNYFKIEVY